MTFDELYNKYLEQGLAPYDARNRAREEAQSFSTIEIQRKNIERIEEAVAKIDERLAQISTILRDPTTYMQNLSKQFPELSYAELSNKANQELEKMSDESRKLMEERKKKNKEIEKAREYINSNKQTLDKNQRKDRQAEINRKGQLDEARKFFAYMDTLVTKDKKTGYDVSNLSDDEIIDIWKEIRKKSPKKFQEIYDNMAKGDRKIPPLNRQTEPQSTPDSPAVDPDAQAQQTPTQVTPVPTVDPDTQAQQTPVQTINPDAQTPDSVVDPDAPTQQTPTQQTSKVGETKKSFKDYFEDPDFDFDDFAMYLKHKLGIKMSGENSVRDDLENFKQYLITEPRAIAFLKYAEEYERRGDTLPKFRDYMGIKSQPESTVDPNAKTQVIPEPVTVEPTPAVDPEAQTQPLPTINPDIQPQPAPAVPSGKSNDQQVVKTQNLDEKPWLKTKLEWFKEKGGLAKQAIKKLVEEKKPEFTKPKQTEEPIVKEYKEVEKTKEKLLDKLSNDFGATNFSKLPEEIREAIRPVNQNINSEGGRSR